MCAEAAKEINQNLNSQDTTCYCSVCMDVTHGNNCSIANSEAESNREATKQANCTQNKAVNAAF